jgi:hypothetical protein
MRHSYTMRLLAIPLVLASAALAQTDADRTSIEKMFTDGLQFTAEGQRDWDRLGPSLADPQRPMSEVTTPKLVLQRIQFLGDRFALVYANLTQFSSMVPVTRVGMLLVLRKAGDRWLADVVRVVQLEWGAGTPLPIVVPEVWPER